VKEEQTGETKLSVAGYALYDPKTNEIGKQGKVLPRTVHEG
jgi:hypothetical protein